MAYHQRSIQDVSSQGTNPYRGRGPSGRLLGMGPQETQLPPAMGVPGLQQTVTGPQVNDTSLSEAVATLRKRSWVLALATLLGIG